MRWISIRKETVGYQALLLGGCAAAAAALISLGNESTRDAIAERRSEDMLESLSQVVPSSLHDNDLLAAATVLDDEDGEPITVYAATRNGQPTGFALQTRGQGYAGPIELLLGVDSEGELLGVRVIAHSETPGLGDKIEIAKDDWILGFDGRSLSNTPPEKWRVRKDGGDIDALTGATVTPRAVVKAVYRGLLFLEEHRNGLAAKNPNAFVEAPHDQGEGS